MARDFRDKRPVVPRPRPGFSLRAFQLLRCFRGKPPAAAKASPSFAPDQELPASRLGPPNIAKPPKSAPLPAQTSQSAARGTHPADTALRRATVRLESAFLFPALPATLGEKPGPFVILP